MVEKSLTTESQLCFSYDKDQIRGSISGPERAVNGARCALGSVPWSTLTGMIRSAEDKSGGSRVVRDHPHGKRIGRCAQLLDLLHQGTEKSVSQSDGAPSSRQVPFEPAQSREIVLGGDQVLGYGC